MTRRSFGRLTNSSTTVTLQCRVTGLHEEALDIRAVFEMELRQALAQVSEIREHLARAEVFRGYRSLTVGFAGLVGLTAAAVQASWLPNPAERLGAYLALWIGAAAINVAVVGIEIWCRARTARTELARHTTIFAVEQFMPSLIAGGLLTLVIALRASESAWMLPGLWALLFSLGIFASCRLLPRAVFAVGAWYLVGGILALLWGRGDAALSPWIMGMIIGVGHLLAAVILHFTLERSNEELE
jgi:hypothetical protein